MKIAIWGLGVSGLSTLKFLNKKDHDIFVVNQGPVETWRNLDAVKTFISKDKCFDEKDFEFEEDIDQIIISPGVDRKNPLVKKYIDSNVEVISDIELAFRSCDKPIIAITGTNGKTTTATMLKWAFDKAGFKTFLGGNIGTPFCEYFAGEYDLVVLELSSFQLESLVQFRAHIAIVLNITPSHMERYADFNDYRNAKLNIFNNQESGDLAIIKDKPVNSHAIFLELRGVANYDFTQSTLKGEHQKENIFCVEQSLKHFNIKNYREITQELINGFVGVDYRMQEVGHRKGLIFINDAKSTNIDATLSALKTYSEDCVLILGGALRDQDVSFLDKLNDYELKRVYCFGEAGGLIQKQLRHFDVVFVETLKEVMSDILTNIESGTILFSPAFPSFDQYQGYAQRGREFNELVSSSL